MCCLRPVIWSRKQIIFFLVLDQVSSLAYSTPFVYLFMVHLCGPSAVPQFELLRFLLISYCVESGGYLLAVTLQLCIILIGFPAFFNVIHSRSLSLLHSADLCPSHLVSSVLSLLLCFVVLTLFMVNATISTVIRNMPCVQMSSALFD